MPQSKVINIYFYCSVAASAVTTGHPHARALLDDAIAVIEKYFWSEQEQMCLESWDEAFSATEDYHGVNANMHAVEAFLIVYDVTHDRKWLDRALRIASVIIHDVARRGEYRVNEHFDAQWNPIRDCNKDNPAHRFRAYGGTTGLWIEWSRLMLHLRAALEARFETPPDWLLEDAKGLFHATILEQADGDGPSALVAVMRCTPHCVSRVMNKADSRWHCKTKTTAITVSGCGWRRRSKTIFMAAENSFPTLICAASRSRCVPANRVWVATNTAMSPGRPHARRTRAAATTGPSSRNPHLSAAKNTIAILITAAR